MALNVEQQELVNAPLDHDVVGIAGAGTGKTTTIMARASKILKEKPTGKLMLITFTRLAAQEMKDRLSKLVSEDDMSRVIVGTFHSVIAHVIRQNAEQVGLTENFSILDEASSNMLYKNAINNLNKDDYDLLLSYFGKPYKMTKAEARKYHNGDANSKQELIEKIKTITGSEIDTSTYKILIRLISTMINTARIDELYTGNFKPDTIKRLQNQVKGKTFYYQGLCPYVFTDDGPKQSVGRDRIYTEDILSNLESTKWPQFKTVVSLLYKAFLQSLKLAISTNVLSYDQILFIGYLMCKPVSSNDQRQVIDKYKQNITYVIVDEYQDTNYLQDYFINALTNGNLTVVGDIDQAIYEFRGGTTKLIQDRAKHARSIDPHSVVNLTYNYRSFQPILDAANMVIKHNIIGSDTRKNLRAIKETTSDYDGVLHIKAHNEIDEARDVLKRIKFMHDIKGIPYKKMAVLVRSRLALGPFKNETKKQKIPFNDLTHYADILESDTMIDVLNYLKVLSNPKDIYAFLSILDRPKRGIGQQKIELMKQKAEQHKQTLIEFVLSDNLQDIEKAGQKAVYHKIKSFMSVYNELIDSDSKHLQRNNDDKILRKALHEILDRVGYLKWINELQSHAKLTENLDIIYGLVDNFEDEYRKTHSNYSLIDVINGFLIDVNNMVNVQDNDGVVINTVHGVKGLEYDEVFVLGLNQDIFPTAKATSEEAIASERRLMYVSITRAKRGLFLYSTESRLGKESQDSMFLREIPNINDVRALS